MKTIVLTDRPPVRIVAADWPVIARARFEAWDGEFEFQANRTWRGAITVRQHKVDGRVLVYASYGYSTRFQGERDEHLRAGRLLAGYGVCDDITSAIIEAIHAVHREIGEPHEQWRELANECIADMPVEDLT